jgi:hypothetical protein
MENPIYEPLLWAIEPVSCCLAHRCELSVQCPHCKTGYIPNVIRRGLNPQIAAGGVVLAPSADIDDGCIAVVEYSLLRRPQTANKHSPCINDGWKMYWIAQQ